MVLPLLLLACSRDEKDCNAPDPVEHDGLIINDDGGDFWSQTDSDLNSVTAERSEQIYDACRAQLESIWGEQDYPERVGFRHNYYLDFGFAPAWSAHAVTHSYFDSSAIDTVNAVLNDSPQASFDHCLVTTSGLMYAAPHEWTHSLHTSVWSFDWLSHWDEYDVNIAPLEEGFADFMANRVQQPFFSDSDPSKHVS